MVVKWILEKPRDYVAVDYDGLWKKLIYELFEEFVLYFLPDLFEDIDFTKEPEFLQQELFKEIIEEKKGKRIADQIVKVYLRDGSEQWVLIHIEVQGDTGDDFSERMFRYYYEIYDRYNRDVVAIALLTGASDRPWTGKYQRGIFGTEVTYKYNWYKFNDQNETELENSSNPFSIAVLAAKYANAAKNDDEKRYRFKYKLMRLVLQKMNQPLDERRIYLSALTYFIDYLLQLPIELTEKLRNEIMISKEAIDLMYLDRKNLPPTFGELRKMEREEGKIEGLLVERKRIVSKLTRENFTVEQIADLTELSIEEVKKLQEQLS
ncbi:hypothetical protein [Bacillus sp. ISL-55]|uniref:hypothetical protein n=1 Tax=Bacillus sp. ISL-55 TaxID=2819134 RepID=UPI001BE63EA0|nr:hypothetical protein [Bacillus sp. ISL-55]MBT2692823.1 hypothetical protein [Bacillus sp. ISL-55]